MTTTSTWLVWTGGMQPVAQSCCVEVELRNGWVITDMASKFVWLCCGSSFDIVRFRAVWS